MTGCFSADDVYYVNNFFSTEMDTSLRIIKHPLLIVLGWLLTLTERDCSARSACRRTIC